MGVTEIVLIIISLLMLYQGYRLGEKRNIGGVGGLILVFLFNLIGLTIVYFSPNKSDPDKAENGKSFRDALIFIGLLALFLVLFVVVVYNIRR